MSAFRCYPEDEKVGFLCSTSKQTSCVIDNANGIIINGDTWKITAKKIGSRSINPLSRSLSN